MITLNPKPKSPEITAKPAKMIEIPEKPVENRAIEEKIPVKTVKKTPLKPKKVANAAKKTVNRSNNDRKLTGPASWPWPFTTTPNRR